MMFGDDDDDENGGHSDGEANRGETQGGEAARRAKETARDSSDTRRRRRRNKRQRGRGAAAGDRAGHDDGGGAASSSSDMEEAGDGETGGAVAAGSSGSRRKLRRKPRGQVRQLSSAPLEAQAQAQVRENASAASQTLAHESMQEPSQPQPRQPPRLKPLRVTTADSRPDPLIGEGNDTSRRGDHRTRRRPQRPRGRSMAARRRESLNQHGSLRQSDETPLPNPGLASAQARGGTRSRRGDVVRSPSNQPAGAAWPSVNEIEDDDLLAEGEVRGHTLLGRTATMSATSGMRERPPSSSVRSHGGRGKDTPEQDVQTKTYVEGARAFQATSGHRTEPAQRLLSDGNTQTTRTLTEYCDAFTRSLVHHSHLTLLGFLLVHVLVLNSVNSDSGRYTSRRCIRFDASLDSKNSMFICLMDSLVLPFATGFQVLSSFCIVSLYIIKAQQPLAGVTFLWYLDAAVHLACVAVGAAVLKQELLLAVYDESTYLKVERGTDTSLERPDASTMVQLLRVRDALGITAGVIYILLRATMPGERAGSRIAPAPLNHTSAEESEDANGTRTGSRFGLTQNERLAGRDGDGQRTRPGSRGGVRASVGAGARAGVAGGEGRAIEEAESMV